MKLLITRPEQQGVEFGAHVQRIGYEPVFQPVLSIRAVQHEAGAIEEAAGFVVTSANALAALAQTHPLDERPVFAVGPDSAEMARRMGFSTVHHGTGTAASLLDLIYHSWKPACGKLVYLSAEHITQDLAAELRRRRYDSVRVVVYEAVAARRLSGELQGMLEDREIKAAAFMSRRSAEIFSALLQIHSLTECVSSVDAFVLSPKVASGLSAAWRAINVALEPTRAGMIGALARRESRRYGV